MEIGDTCFEDATSASIVYAAIAALVLHLGLEKPSKDAQPKVESVLIWGGGSSIGFYAVQFAAQVHLLSSKQN
jgi:NADPH:quinone reductase-like Zn-dependent oxidoreductase